MRIGRRWAVPGAWACCLQTLTLNIVGNDNRLDLALALEAADSFRLTLPEAKAQMAAIRAAVGQWQQVSTRKRLTKTAQSDMAPAFHRAAMPQGTVRVSAPQAQG